MQSSRSIGQVKSINVMINLLHRRMNEIDAMCMLVVKLVSSIFHAGSQKLNNFQCLLFINDKLHASYGEIVYKKAVK